VSISPSDDEVLSNPNLSAVLFRIENKMRTTQILSHLYYTEEILIKLLKVKTKQKDPMV